MPRGYPLKFRPAHVVAAEDMARFLAKVDKTESCWLWTAFCDKHGYAKFSVGGRTRRAHRFAFERFVGPIPEGYEIDHLCRNRSCVNPAHMEAVTPRVNGYRSFSPMGVNHRKTHCPYGHPYDAANTYLTPREGSRQCRECKNARNAARYPGSSPSAKSL